MDALSGMRTHDPSVRASEGSSCLTLDRAANVIGHEADHSPATSAERKNVHLHCLICLVGVVPN
jgi:hypothetical protein